MGKKNRMSAQEELEKLQHTDTASLKRKLKEAENEMTNLERLLRPLEACLGNPTNRLKNKIYNLRRTHHQMECRAINIRRILLHRESNGPVIVRLAPSEA